jgi:hypothetical protein
MAGPLQRDGGALARVPVRWRAAVVLGALGFVSGMLTLELGVDLVQLPGSLGANPTGGKADAFGVGAVVAAFWAFGLAFAVAMALGVFLWTGERP